MKLATGTLAVLLVALALSGSAAAAYPERPIRLIIPFVPGGPSDILSRLVGGKLSEVLGQPIVADNRGSVGGVLGFELGAKAPPDGYTMLLAAYSGITINPYVYKKLPYNPLRDLQPVVQLTMGGNVMCVTPSVPAHSVKEFIELAKSRPGKINYASTGTGPLLGTELFKKMAGVDLVNIPYKGTGQAVIDLMGGRVQMMLVNPLVAVPQSKSGALRALAVTSAKRSSALPDVPTVAESGLPGYKNITWHSIVVPAGTPKPIVKRLNEELVKILAMPDVHERIQGQGLDPVGGTPEQLSALIKQESAMYKKLVKDIGYQPQ